MTIDLADATPAQVRKVVLQTVDLAIADYGKKGGAARRTGEELCWRFCEGWRVGHKRMLSTVYNKTIWTLAQSDQEREAVE